VLERSGVGAEIEAATLPLSAAYRAVAGDNLEFALSGGEDYELLFACVRVAAKPPSRDGLACRRVASARSSVPDRRARLVGKTGSSQLAAPVRRMGSIEGSRRIMILLPS